MLMIRFMRIGRKNQPSFKIVVTEKTKSSTGGRFVEEVGFYNPVTKEKVLKPERLKYWISQGAQPTPTVSNLLISEKVTEGEKTPKHKKAKQAAGDGNQVSSGNLVSQSEPETALNSIPEKPTETPSPAPAEPPAAPPAGA